MSGWLWLLAAILLEVCGTTFMKFTGGLSKVGPSVAMFSCYAAAFTCLSFSLKSVELGTAYAIWSGLGTAIIALIGIFWFSESVSLIKIGSIMLIILGVVGLNLASTLGVAKG